MADSGHLDEQLAWPLDFGHAKLVELLNHFEISVSSLSPIAHLVSDAKSAPRVEPDPLRHSPQVADALRVLAAPRQLLLLRRTREQRTGGGTDVVGFLNDGERIARFDVGTQGCMVDRPCDHTEFVQLLGGLVTFDGGGADEQPTIMVSQRFLEAIVALRRAGLFAADAPLTRHAAEAVIRAIPGWGAQAAESLGALERDGVLRLDGDIVVQQPQWLARYPYLAKRSQLALDAVELADLRAARPHRKRFAVLGEPAEHVVFLPAACDEIDRHIAVEINQMSPDAVARGVVQTLAPPLAPPTSPTSDCSTGSLPSTSANRGKSPASPWQLHTLEQLVAPVDPNWNPPAALLAPCATIEVTSAGPGGRGLEHHVLSLDPRSAVEWILEGSWVQWREIAPDDVFARIDKLIPARLVGISGVSTAKVPVAAVFDVFDSKAASKDAAISALSELSAVCDDRKPVLHIIRVRRGTGSACREHVIMLVSSASERAWRVERHDEAAFRIREIAAGDIAAEIFDVLADGTTTRHANPSSAHAQPGNVAPRR